MTPHHACFLIPLLLLAAAAPAQKKVTYEDDLLPVLRNSCLNCHNSDKKKVGLDLSSYDTLMAGSDNGKVVTAGDADASLLFRVVAHKEEPAMPKGGDKLSDRDLAVFHDWINGGLLETSKSEAVVSDKPKVDLALSNVPSGKPTGPAAMPRDLSMEPVVYSQRSGPLASLACSPWAPLVALGGQRQIVLYQSQSLEELGVLPFPEGIPAVLKFSRNGSLLLAGGGEGGRVGKVILYDVASGNRAAEVGNEFDTVLAADLTPDQSIVALGGPGKVLKAYAVKNNQLLWSVKKHTDWVTAVACSPDGILVASGDRAGNLYVWEARNGREFYNLIGHKEGITDLAFRADSNVLASASQDGSIKLWNMHDGAQIRSIGAHGSGVLALAFAHDGRLVSGGRDNAVRTWTGDGGNQRTFDAFSDIALHVAFTDDDARVIAGDWTGKVRVWNAADGKMLGELSADPPTTAQRAAALDQRIGDLQAAADKAAAAAAAAQGAADKAAADIQTAKIAADAAAKALDSARAEEHAAKSIAAAAPADSTAPKQAKRAVETKQAEAKRLAQVEHDATAGRDEAVAAQKNLAAQLTDRQKEAVAAKATADAAAAAAQKSPDDKSLAASAEQAKVAAARAADAVAQAQKMLDVKSNAVQSLTDAAAKAAASSAQAATALTAAQNAATIAARAEEKSIAAAHAAGVASAKVIAAAADSAAATKAIPAKIEQAKSAAANLAAAKSTAEAAAAQLAAAKAQLAHLKTPPVAAATPRSQVATTQQAPANSHAK